MKLFVYMFFVHEGTPTYILLCNLVLKKYQINNLDSLIYIQDV